MRFINLQVGQENRKERINSDLGFWFNSGWVGDLCFGIQQRSGQSFLGCWHLPFILASVCVGEVPGALFCLFWRTWDSFSSDFAILNVQELITFLVMVKALLGQKALSCRASTGLMHCCSQTWGGFSFMVEFLCFYLIFEFDNFGMGLTSILLKSN